MSRHTERRATARPSIPPPINRAIEAAAAAGGGTVWFPAGNYLSYSIHLKSNVALYLDQGATIIAADSPGAGRRRRRLRCRRAERMEPVPGFRPQPLAQQPDLGRRAGEHLDPGPRAIWGKGLSRGTGRRPARGRPRRRQQVDQPEELPQRPAARLLHPARRPLRHPGHRRRQLHDRQPEDRHQPRRHRHRLLPQRAHLELLRQLAVGRRHLPEELLRPGLAPSPPNSSPSRTAT